MFLGTRLWCTRGYDDGRLSPETHTAVSQKSGILCIMSLRLLYTGRRISLYFCSTSSTLSLASSFTCPPNPVAWVFCDSTLSSLHQSTTISEEIAPSEKNSLYTAERCLKFVLNASLQEIEKAQVFNWTHQPQPTLFTTLLPHPSYSTRQGLPLRLPKTNQKKTFKKRKQLPPEYTLTVVIAQRHCRSMHGPSGHRKHVPKQELASPDALKQLVGKNCGI